MNVSIKEETFKWDKSRFLENILKKLIVGAAGELNNISKVRKRDLDDALDRVDEMGKIIDSILEVIKDNEEAYIKYIKLKSKFIMEKASKDIIQTEVEQDLLFENSNREEEE